MHAHINTRRDSPKIKIFFFFRGNSIVNGGGFEF